MSTHICCLSRRCLRSSSFFNNIKVPVGKQNFQKQSDIFIFSQRQKQSFAFSQLSRKCMAATSPQTGNFSNVRGIVNIDRLVLLSVGAAFFGCLFYWDKRGRQPKQVVQVQKIHAMVTKAQNAVHSGHYEEASALYKEALDLAHIANAGETVSVNSSTLIMIVDQLATLGFELQRWEESEALFKETLHKMLDSGIPKNDNGIVEVSLKLAKVYAAQGRDDLAADGFSFCVETLDKKIQGLKELPQETLVLFGVALTEHATNLKETGRLQESEKAFYRALSIAKQVLGPRHEQTSVLINDLATVYDEEGRYNKAERLAQKAIDIAKETAPENLPAYTYNLGAILMHKGEFSRARTAFWQALQLAEENEDEETLELVKNSMMKLDVDTS